MLDRGLDLRHIRIMLILDRKRIKQEPFPEEIKERELEMTDKLLYKIASKRVKALTDMTTTNKKPYRMKEDKTPEELLSENEHLYGKKEAKG